MRGALINALGFLPFLVFILGLVGIATLRRRHIEGRLSDSEYRRAVRLGAAACLLAWLGVAIVLVILVR